MRTVHPPSDVHTQDAQLIKHSHTIWGALLPTWTAPEAVRVRDMSPIIDALKDPSACARVAEALAVRVQNSRKGGRP